MSSILVPCNLPGLGVELRALSLGSATRLSKITRVKLNFFIIYSQKYTRVHAQYFDGAVDNIVTNSDPIAVLFLLLNVINENIYEYGI